MEEAGVAGGNVKGKYNANLGFWIVSLALRAQRHLSLSWSLRGQNCVNVPTPKTIVSKNELFCQFNSQILQLLTSCLFLAGTVSECTGFTAYLNRYHGRTRVMMYSGIAFMIAGILFAAAFHVSMIFIGRILQGFAISFASVSVPIYNSEMSPPQFRGTFNQLFQLFLTLFILIAQVINLIMHVTGAENSWGFRLSLGFAFVPAFMLFMAGTFLPDSPNSLLERGYITQARKNLEYIRGTKDVDVEFNDIVEAAELAAAVKHPWRNLFSAKYRPQLVLSACCTLFQQWTGINILIFYAPEIFLALGTTRTISLVAGIIIGACNHLSTYVSAILADYLGRRFLFLEAGVQMFSALIVISISLLCLPASSIWEAWYILGMACVFDMAYAWSWGPLAWTYPSEIQVLETRSAGMAVTSLFNLLFSFVIGQTFLSMLCTLQWGVFLLFACCVAFMTTFVYLFFPETKGIPIEECPLLFKTHWFWKRYANRSVGFQERMVMERKMLEAAEQGKPLPDIPGMESVKDDIISQNPTLAAHIPDVQPGDAGNPKRHGSADGRALELWLREYQTTHTFFERHAAAAAAMVPNLGRIQGLTGCEGFSQSA
ncbi:hypothetical protein WJX84_000121 [Apatococcus fuscideae]|uniref:Major facilitator superfamily (MFS) profile domain-containing protein n=1 Tax=Apatococcus fuscideae TaxID=2026836 RepID=A0AAW1T9M1_9CHLO